ncbi:MAG: hypothetical protein GX823_06420 [Clostridiales bacterium]|nr:hypothetical protein [Clostridiales bacterium]
MNLFKKAPYLLAALVLLLASCSENGGTVATPDASPSEDIPVTEDASESGDEGSEYENFVMDYSEGIGENGLWEGVSAYDYIEPFDYVGIEIPYATHTVSDAALQAEIDYLLDYYTVENQVTDRVVEDGDTVNIDYVGSIDGIEFSGGSTGGAGTEVIIGVSQYIDDFLEQIIGHMPGETFDVNVTFPEDYGNEDLNGKDALFVTTVNYISETVRSELTDDFAAAHMGEYGWTTVEELTAGISDSLSSSAVISYIRQYLVDTVTVLSLPEPLLAYQRNVVISAYKDNAASYGMDLESFLAMFFGVESVDALLEHSAAEIESAVVYLVAIQAIAEDLELQITEIDLQNYFADLIGSPDYSQYEAVFGRPYLMQAIMSNAVGTYLTDNAVYLEA